MRRYVATAALLCFFVSCLGFSQGGNAQLGGIVTDQSKALIPGVMITVTNTETGITNTAITNESGSYNFPSLQPGKAYKASASLPGFQTKTVNDLELGGAGNIRQDFQLSVGTTSTLVEVQSEANSVITAAGASVGDVLTDARIRTLPMVGNNVLDLLDILPGLRLSPLGSTGDTIGGLGMNTVNATRDGLSINDGRYDAQTWGRSAMSTTVLNPDLVGEIRLILSPVDAELGRGNSQIQITTRSGTNKYTGSAVWNIQNTALNANTWENNNDTVGGVWTPTKPDWRNNHQYTISYGGPIVRNKTFFFALWDHNINNTRTLQSPTVMTDVARQGIYRYWTGWNPAAAGTAPTTTPTTNANPVYASVNDVGLPTAPLVNPDNSSYTGSLVCFSMFGNIKLGAKGAITPFTQADCPGGTAVINGTPWDPKRLTFDTTGYISKLIDLMPHPNYFRAGDGLNTAQYRYVRGRKGSTNGANAVTGTDAASNRKQINIKIDENFTTNHKVSGSLSYQMDDNADNLAAWQDGINGTQRSRPIVLTLNGTSTLSSTMLNEARFGMNYNNRAELPPWRSPNSDVRAAAEALFLQGGQGHGKTYPVVINPSTGTFAVNGELNALSVNIGNVTSLYNYADTLSWTRGKHAFKFGADLRFPRSNGFNAQTLPVATLGNNASASSTVSPFATTTNFATQLLNLPSTARTNVTSLLYLMNGSVSSITYQYWMESQTDKDSATWQDWSTRDQRYRKQVSSDYAFFVKDDFKATKSLTLNLGVRYEVHRSPFLASGLTSAPLGLGDGLFGAGRGAGGQLFANWLQPGNIFLTGYGSTPAVPLACKSGVTQSPLLPVSTCDPAKQTTLEFVGKNTPNPGKKVIPDDLNNFGPNIGFAWQVPWFGAGKTQVRGGYGVTFGAASNNGINTDTLLGSAPGNTLAGATSVGDTNIAPILTTRALNLTDIPTLVPVRPVRAPGATVPIYARSVGFQAYDPNFATPYTQNLTLSVTRQVTRLVTLDVRYIGTLARKQAGNVDLNTSTVFYNPELLDALNRTRAGENAPLFDQMFAGLSLTTTAGYGAIGTCVANATAPGAGLEGCAAGQVRQHGSAHLRRSAATSGALGAPTLQTALANGDFEYVSNLLPIMTATSGATNLPVDPGTGQTVTGVQQRVLRNGCDRIANGLYNPAAAASATNIPTRCFPENYVQANPQFSTATYNGNFGHSNYHSLQIQTSLRPVHGISIQGTYAWAKSMQDVANFANVWTDPLQRSLDWARGRQGPHTFRANGTFELPIGPNKLLFANTTGWIARAIERWQTSFIVNLASGSPADILGAGNMRYGNGRMVATQYWRMPSGQTTWDRTISASVKQGAWYGTPSPFVSVRDPQCASPLVGATDSMGFNLQAVCNLNALGLIVPAGTAGANTIATSGTSYLLGLVNPTPGNLGTLGARTLDYWGQFQLDANVSKNFRLTESKSLQLRIDTRNVLNHPTPGIPSFSITSLGNITTKSGSRTFQGQLRLTF